MSETIAVEKISQEEINEMGYNNTDSYNHMIKVATGLSKSNIIPKDYQGNVANCMIAIEMSQRLGISPFGVMQSMYIVHGKPAWASTFIIGQINASSKFNGSLQFRKEGTIGSDDRAYTAYAYNQAGELLEGTPVSVKMAKTEGWFSKNGSKWQTMPEQMLAYRAATFFARLYAPELLLGIQTQDEIIDVEGSIVSDREINETFGIKTPEEQTLNFVEEKPVEEPKPELPKEEFIDDDQGRLINTKTGKPL